MPTWFILFCYVASRAWRRPRTPGSGALGVIVGRLSPDELARLAEKAMDKALAVAVVVVVGCVLVAGAFAGASAVSARQSPTTADATAQTAGSMPDQPGSTAP